MSHRQFDCTPSAPALARAMGIEWTMRGESLWLSKLQLVVATHLLA